jgi:hypothetical protein
LAIGVPEITSPDRSKRVRDDDVEVALDVDHRVQFGDELHLRAQPQGYDNGRLEVIQMRRLYTDDQRTSLAGGRGTPGKPVETEPGH